MYESFLLLDKNTAYYYHGHAEQTKEYPQDFGEMRRLRSELQDLCGITEIEALNVLTGHNVDFYVKMYNGYSDETTRELRQINPRRQCIAVT